MIKADSVLMYFEGNYSFSLHYCFQFTRTHTDGETPDTNCIAKVNILGHFVTPGRRKKKKEKKIVIVQKGTGSTRIQKFLGSFVFPYFDHLLDIKWGRGGGVS